MEALLLARKTIHTVPFVDSASGPGMRSKIPDERIRAT
jgi:hypothetical protein